MKMSIPYEKEIVFNTKIAEITSISLEYEANVLDDDIEGEFIVSGDYKIHEFTKYDDDFEEMIKNNLPSKIYILDIEMKD